MCLVSEVVWVDLRKPCDNFSLSSAVGASVTGIPLVSGFGTRDSNAQRISLES